MDVLRASRRSGWGLGSLAVARRGWANRIATAGGASASARASGSVGAAAMDAHVEELCIMRREVCLPDMNWPAANELEDDRDERTLGDTSCSTTLGSSLREGCACKHPGRWLRRPEQFCYQTRKNR
ncbi:hypothetical protein TRAPUB_305 [Trametes pubescens]|uniref:Uncharacterized protein n=1 Tax=Trametes pubescens TaxID=154538 RepID=A0A1M2VMG2_TRAPU|nr:hypothetical protein TRAPUB_305 [Trametes pubescens]